MIALNFNHVNHDLEKAFNNSVSSWKGNDKKEIKMRKRTYEQFKERWKTRTKMKDNVEIGQKINE